ncbi:MAG: HTH domain-containing protein [Planctomycetota bacterium]
MMNVRAAAVQILREAGEPLHAREITKRMTAGGLWRSEGKTPAATVGARLYSDIKKSGDKSPFVLVASQTFGLHENGAKPSSSSKRPVEPKTKVSATTYSFLKAAEKVLEQFGNKKPMHFRDITAKALKLGWLDTQGKTPDATMAAQLYTASKRAQRQGEGPLFVQHARGMFGLSKWMGQGLVLEIDQQNQRARKALLARLLALSWGQFEVLIGRLLAEMGFDDIEVYRKSGDGGIDVRATLVVGGTIRTRMAIQAKKWKANVQSPVVQQVRGSLGTHEQGLIITTSDFSPGAKREAERSDAVPVGLMNGEQLARLLVAHEIGVVKRPFFLIELEEPEGQASTKVKEI